MEEASGHQGGLCRPVSKRFPVDGTILCSTRRKSFNSSSQITIQKVTSMLLT